MGISGLLPCLRSIEEVTHIKAFAGQKLGIDTYCWLHRLCRGSAEALVNGTPTTHYLQNLTMRVDTFLRHNIHLVMVFDGADIPLKAGTNTDRRAKRRGARERASALAAQGRVQEARGEYAAALDISPEIAQSLIRVLRAKDVECIVAPYEADAQLAYLAHTGYVDAVVTEDSDLLAYLTPIVIFKVDHAGTGIVVRSERLPEARDLQFTSFTRDMVLTSFIMAGCDYVPSLRGVGIKKANKLVAEHKSIARILEVLRSDQRYKAAVADLGTYEHQFLKAFLTFRHHIVYDPREQRARHFHDLHEGALDDRWVAGVLGALWEPATARGVCSECTLNPETLEPYDEAHPTLRNAAQFLAGMVAARKAQASFQRLRGAVTALQGATGTHAVPYNNQRAVGDESEAPFHQRRRAGGTSSSRSPERADAAAAANTRKRRRSKMSVSPSRRSISRSRSRSLSQSLTRHSRSPEAVALAAPRRAVDASLSSSRSPDASPDHAAPPRIHLVGGCFLGPTRSPPTTVPVGGREKLPFRAPRTGAGDSGAGASASPPAPTGSGTSPQPKRLKPTQRLVRTTYFKEVVEVRATGRGAGEGNAAGRYRDRRANGVEGEGRSASGAVSAAADPRGTHQPLGGAVDPARATLAERLRPRAPQRFEDLLQAVPVVEAERAHYELDAAAAASAAPPPPPQRSPQKLIRVRSHAAAAGGMGGAAAALYTQMASQATPAAAAAAATAEPPAARTSQPPQRGGVAPLDLLSRGGGAAGGLPLTAARQPQQRRSSGGSSGGGSARAAPAGRPAAVEPLEPQQQQHQPRTAQISQPPAVSIQGGPGVRSQGSDLTEADGGAEGAGEDSEVRGGQGPGKRGRAVDAGVGVDAANNREAAAADDRDGVDLDAEAAFLAARPRCPHNACGVVHSVFDVRCVVLARAAQAEERRLRQEQQQAAVPAGSGMYNTARGAASRRGVGAHLGVPSRDSLAELAKHSSNSGSTNSSSSTPRAAGEWTQRRGGATPTQSTPGPRVRGGVLPPRLGDDADSPIDVDAILAASTPPREGAAAADAAEAPFHADPAEGLRRLGALGRGRASGGR